MAKIFNYLPPTDAANIEHDAIPFNQPSTYTRLTFTRNADPIIYCNYPEAIGAQGLGLALAEHKYCINQQQIPAGEAQIYFSHNNQCGQNLKYRIHIYNPNGSTATVTRSNCGFSMGWPDPGKTITDFFNSSSATITVAKTSSAWLTQEYSIPNNTAFNGLVRLQTDKSVIITVYAYLNASAIKGTEVVFPYSTDWSGDISVYSGIGQGYFLNVNHGTITAKSLRDDAPYRFATNVGYNGEGFTPNINEITPIKLVGTNLTANISSNTETLRNLGNWCTQNHHTISFKNDLEYTVTIYGRISSTHDKSKQDSPYDGNTQVIRIGRYMNSIKLETDHTWKWCKIILPAGCTTHVDYQQVLASYGNALTYHQFSLE